MTTGALLLGRLHGAASGAMIKVLGGAVLTLIGTLLLFKHTGNLG